MENGPLHRVLYNERKLRSGWRIAIFFALFTLFAIAGQLVTGFLPRQVEMWVAILVLLIAALGAGWILLARLDGRPIGALGFALIPAIWRELGWGLAVGGGMIALASMLIFVTGGAHFVTDAGTASQYVGFLLGTLVFFSLAAAWEEAVFRGYPFQVLVEGIGAWPAVLVSSGLFSALHAWNPNVDAIALANIFLAGIMLSVAYLRTRSLWFATAVHVGWNWTMASVFDFPVSGLVFDTPLYSIVPTGERWWTGGTFGPEAGLAGTIALLVGTLWMLRTGYLREAPEMRELGPIVNNRLGGARW